MAVSAAASTYSVLLTISSMGAMSAGGIMMPLLFGVQRFVAVSEGLGVPPARVHQEMASMLQWASGELNFLSDVVVPAGSSSEGRLLSEANSPNTTTENALGGAVVLLRPAKLTSLYNKLITLALAICLTFVIQSIILSCWSRLVNRRYYRQQRLVKPSKDVTDGVHVEPICCFGLCGPRRRRKPAKFFPFPKSLVWPSPLYFSCCIFVTGLTRNSVYLLAQAPENCGPECVVVPVFIIGVLLALVLLTAMDLLAFRRKHGSGVNWKPAVKHKDPMDVADPYMRARAKWRVHAASMRIITNEQLLYVQQGTFKLGHGSFSLKRSRASSYRTPGSFRYRVHPQGDASIEGDGFHSRIQMSGIHRPWSATRRGHHARITSPEGTTSSRIDPPPSPPDEPSLVSDQLTLTPRSQALLDSINMPDEPRLIATPFIALNQVDSHRISSSSGISASRGSCTPASITVPSDTEAIDAVNAQNQPPMFQQGRLSFRQLSDEATARASSTTVPPRFETKLKLKELSDERMDKILSGRTSPRLSSGSPYPTARGGHSVSSPGAATEPTSSVPFTEDDAEQTLKPLDDEDGLEGQADEQVATGATGNRGRLRRMTLVEARASAREKLAEKGHQDRRSGGFGLPEADSKEPARTERILANPFALHRKHTGDAFNAIEGFLLFRVHGASRMGVCYRLLVICVNMLFGVLSGLRPLLHPGSQGAMFQAAIICLLQFFMSFVCFRYLPDADRIISRFAGTQFFSEGISSCMLWIATFGDSSGEVADYADNVTLSGSHSNTSSLHLPAASSPILSNASSTTTTPSEGRLCVCELDASTWVIQMQLVAFGLSLMAICVPMVQLLEQRAVTPTINIIVAKGASPIALLAAAYMLAASLPKQLTALIGRGEAGAMDAADAAGSASADAGDDAVEASASGDGGGAGGGGADIGGQGGDGADCADEVDPCEDVEADDGGGAVELAAESAAETAVRVSRLLARAVAAKEVSGRQLEVADSKMPSIEEGSVVSFDSFSGQLHASSRFKNSTSARRSAGVTSDAADDANEDDNDACDDM